LIDMQGFKMWIVSENLNEKNWILLALLFPSSPFHPFPSLLLFKNNY
jgi:hypothetical protein